MVLAAARRRIPAALMEADAHLGLANRLAAPFAQRVFLSFPIPGREPPKYRVTGRPIPARSQLVPREEARRLFELPPDGPVLLVAGGSLGARSLNDLAVESFGPAGPAVLHLSGEREYDRLRERVSRPDYRLLPFTDELRRCAGRSRPRALARGRRSLGAGGCGETGDPRPVSGSRPPTTRRRTRATSRPPAARSSCPRTSSGACRRSCGRCSATHAGSRRWRTAMRQAARPDAADEIAEELIALAAA